MITALRISNFALIDEVELNFQSGYTVLTGETGSGKSILLHALQLILGERAELSVIGPSSPKAIVEANFNLNQSYVAFFEEHDLDYDVNTIIRREIAKEGKSRAFINDVPVSLQTLKSLTSRLVQIHSQYNTLELRSKSFQLELIDVLTGLMTERKSFEKKYNAFESVSKELKSLNEQYHAAVQAEDYDRFILDELQELSLGSTDFSQLEIDITRMENASQILQVFGEISEITAENGTYEQLYRLKGSVDKQANYDPQLQSMKERLDSILLELKDLSLEANDAMDQLDTNESDKASMMEKWNSFNKILTKHRLSSADELTAMYEQLTSKLNSLDALLHACTQKRKEHAQLQTDLWKDARYLQDQRQKRIPVILSILQDRLKELKLPHTTLKFELSELTEFNRTGCTGVEFLFSANYGIEAVPIEKAASGGELSRLMLALQQLISEKQDLPTIFFDEIDTGVSGDVALKMGQLLEKMGQTVQLMAISHLPQVAARAAQHMVVAKELRNERMQTTVRVLNERERPQEIARLMSGEVITEAALQNAENLLNEK
ncbi:MAG: repair protein RecN [Bacteroidota bacterium]|jgi:DNA repair protein RecN (Recombination protein N)